MKNYQEFDSNKFNLQLFAGSGHGVTTPSSNSPVTTYGIDRERRELDVSKQIADLVPSESPFSVILMKAKKEKVGSQEFSWYDQKPGNWWTDVVSTADNAVTTITVADASIFRASDLAKVASTGEVLFVTGINEDTDTITVKRGYGETSAAAIDANSGLMRMGNAMKQFSVAPEPKIVQPFRGYNVTQIFRTPFDQSETANSESVKTVESERNRLTRLKGLEHRLDIERALVFGERHVDPTAKRSTAGGLLSFVKNHFMDVENKLDEGAFEEFNQELFTYGSRSKLLICSRSVLSLINAFGRDRLETTSGEETYGLRMKNYISAHGDLYIVPSLTLEREYGSMAIGVDMDNVKFKVFRDTKLVKNIQANDEDGWRDEYISEVSLEVRLPQTHCVLHNATNTAL